MNPEDMNVHVLPGLSVSTHAGGKGTFAFCISRSCHQRFFNCQTSEREVSLSSYNT